MPISLAKYICCRKPASSQFSYSLKWFWLSWIIAPPRPSSWSKLPETKARPSPGKNVKKSIGDISDFNRGNPCGTLNIPADRIRVGSCEPRKPKLPESWRTLSICLCPAPPDKVSYSSQPPFKTTKHLVNRRGRSLSRILIRSVTISMLGFFSFPFLFSPIVAYLYLFNSTQKDAFALLDAEGRCVLLRTFKDAEMAKPEWQEGLRRVLETFQRNVGVAAKKHRRGDYPVIPCGYNQASGNNKGVSQVDPWLLVCSYLPPVVTVSQRFREEASSGLRGILCHQGVAAYFVNCSSYKDAPSNQCSLGRAWRRSWGNGTQECMHVLKNAFPTGSARSIPTFNCHLGSVFLLVTSTFRR